jgi:hypothetical protein
MTDATARLRSAVIGGIFGLSVAAWGVMASGAGHFVLALMLFISPFGAGLLFWPLWGYVTAGRMSVYMRITFLSTMVVHYLALIYYLRDDGFSSDWSLIQRQPDIGMRALLSVGVYLVAQGFLWRRFLVAGLRSDKTQE